jgi:hypothetical protein
LAELTDVRIKKAKALTDDCREERLFTLKQEREAYTFFSRANKGMC